VRRRHRQTERRSKILIQRNALCICARGCELVRPRAAGL